MKRFFGIFFFALLFGYSPFARAALWDRGGGLIYDDVLDITFLDDATEMQWLDPAMPSRTVALNYVADIEYYDPIRDVIWDDWRMPEITDITVTWPSMDTDVESELSHLYYNEFSKNPFDPSPFENLPEATYWLGSGGFGHPAPGIWAFQFTTGLHAGQDPYDYHYVLPVRTGDVPIPGAVWLLGSGLIGLVGLRQKFKR
jgi:hypothetical protein